MELQALNSEFQASYLVESYESLVWTERYSTAGDFQLTSNDIARTLQQLPKESYVSLRESTVPMMVETHKIEKKKNAAPLLTVSGRSFEACALERRASVNSMPVSNIRTAWTISAQKGSDAAYKAIRVVIGDKARMQNNAQVLPLILPAVSLNDAIPEVDLVLPKDYSTLTTDTFEIKADELYKTVLELLETNSHGIKSNRPKAGQSQVGVEIYNGANLTDLVVFDARFDQLDDATYLLSSLGSSNVAYIYGSTGSQQVLKTSATEPSGLSRRVLLIDASSDSTANTPDIRRNRGLVELYKYNSTALFDGEVAEQVAQGYNKSYFLGDIIKLTGEYGLSQNVRVAEFIRSSDKNGDKAYPTLEAITS